MSLIAHYLDADNQIHRNIDAEAVQTARESQTGLLWVDFHDPGDDERDLLLDEFQFHPLVVDGVINPDVRPARVEDFGDYIFVNVRSVDYTAETEVVQTTDMGMFIGQNFVVTIHNSEMPSVEAVKQLVEIDGRPMRKGPGFFAHALFDALIQAILPTLDLMEDRADAIEEQVLTDPDQYALTALMALKRSCLSLNRALAPQREVLNRLGRREFDIIGHDVDLYFRDLADDLIRVQAANDAIRERTDTSLATYLSVVGNRQNEIMKVLVDRRHGIPATRLDRRPLRHELREHARHWVQMGVSHSSRCQRLRRSTGCLDVLDKTLGHRRCRILPPPPPQKTRPTSRRSDSPCRIPRQHRNPQPATHGSSRDF